MATIEHKNIVSWGFYTVEWLIFDDKIFWGFCECLENVKDNYPQILWSSSPIAYHLLILNN